MGIHISAKSGDIAETVLLPGDPLRARFLATNYLTDPICYSQTRGMLGYTGEYQGKRISVQGTGMGLPSLSIYVTELIRDYGVKNLIRVGTCGSFQKTVRVRDIVLVMAACTDSAINKHRFRGCDYAPTADFGLLSIAYELAVKGSLTVHVGPILSSDSFYQDDEGRWKMWAAYGVLGTEMETTALYTLAARHGVRALTILTVSDSFLSDAFTGPKERETGLTEMAQLALGVCSRI